MVDAFLECGDLLRKCSKPIRGGAKSTAPWRPFVLACANCPPTRPVRLPYPGGGGSRRSWFAGAGARVFDIQFVPTAISAQGDGVRNLLDELKSLGALEVLAQPDAGAAAVAIGRFG
jgi:two-component system chemotaxis sensor kinase CheA